MNFNAEIKLQTSNNKYFNKLANMFINDLPKYIAREVLNNWLTMKHVCLLDKAVCNSVERPRLLLQLEDVRVDGLNNTYVSQCYMKWLTVRKVKIDTLTLKMGSIFRAFKPDKNTFECLRHLQILDIDCPKSTVEEDFVLLIKKCSNLTNLRLIASENFSSNKNMIRIIANSCPKLAVLRFEFRSISSHVKDSDFIHLASKCPLLRSVYVENFKMSQKCFEAFVNDCAELTEISYNTAADVDTVPCEITAIIASHTVTGLYLSTDCIGFDFDCTNSTSKLQHVNIMGCSSQYVVPIMKVLAEGNCCDSLTEIMLMDVEEICVRSQTAQLLAIANKFRGIKKFIMVNSKAATTQQVTYTPQLTGSQHSLTSLCWQMNPYIGRQGFLHLLHKVLGKFPNLTELSMHKLHALELHFELPNIVVQLAARSVVTRIYSIGNVYQHRKQYNVPAHLRNTVRVKFIQDYVEITSI